MRVFYLACSGYFSLLATTLITAKVSCALSMRVLVRTGVNQRLHHNHSKHANTNNLFSISGQCDISHARYHHTTVLQKYPSVVNLCCSPREMSHISLIYIDEDGFVLQKNLPNMVVESCDCA